MEHIINAKGLNGDNNILSYVKKQMLIDLQKFFFAMTGMGTSIIDPNGNQVTDPVGLPEFCSEYMFKSRVGLMMCSHCCFFCAEETKELGHHKINYCHAGLVEFTAPLVVDKEIVAVIVGGRVFRNPPNEAEIRSMAREMGLDSDAVWEAAQKVPVIPIDLIDRSASFLYDTALSISELIEANLLIEEMGKDLERANRLKTDFLANMSHEIRTPMNAVLGMADLALRENLSPVARDCVNQISSSGRGLINIINDILDYTKVASGQVDIVTDEYEPVGLINDVATVIMSRIVDKDIEFLIDVDPKIPLRLWGDSQRIRQIIINLANNAIKFTKEGYVTLKVRYENIDEENISLKFWVKDTGIGIKPEDIDKLFGSFQQVDVESHRETEGTGLGLSIVSNLVNRMNGGVHVESEYGKGSTFSFDIPQKISDSRPSVSLSEPEKYGMAGFFLHESVARDFQDDAGKLGVKTTVLTDVQNAVAEVSTYILSNPGKKIYIVTEQAIFNLDILDSIDRTGSVFKNVEFVILADTFSDARKYDKLEAVHILRKPISVLNLAMLLNREEVIVGSEKREKKNKLFTAPEAHVLVVDDNSVNLTVAAGLLEPLNMQVDQALSGKECLDMIEKVKYDLIFLDHMMPGMDGIDTTRIIRRFHPEYKDVPIIALTANAMSGAKAMFLSEGMNDFIPKPIDVKMLLDKVYQWIPDEKIIESLECEEENDTEEEILQIGNLNTSEALRMLGSKNVYMTILKEYYKTINSKAKEIERFWREEDWTGYTIIVHALKSASRQIGAIELADLAAELEKAGNSLDVGKIKRETGRLLEMYKNLEPVLSPIFEDSNGNEEKAPADASVTAELIEKMREALDNLDMDVMEEVVNSMNKYSYDDFYSALLGELNDAVSILDVDTCSEILDRWEA